MVEISKFRNESDIKDLLESFKRRKKANNYKRNVPLLFLWSWIVSIRDSFFNQ